MTCYSARLFVIAAISYSIQRSVDLFDSTYLTLVYQDLVAHDCSLSRPFLYPHHLVAMGVILGVVGMMNVVVGRRAWLRI
jgi:hypothetical protein